MTELRSRSAHREPVSVYTRMSRLLDVKLGSETDTVRLATQGVTILSFRRAADKLKFAKSLVAPESTIRRRSNTNARFTEAESERLIRLARIYAEAVELFGDEAQALQWLRTPEAYIPDQAPITPLELAVKDSGARLLEAHIRRTAHGIFLMRLWRISAYPGLSGLGGHYVDGRWHTIPRTVLYLAGHPALAMVEVMAHMRLNLTAIPTTVKLIAVNVDGIAALSVPPSLPAGWQANEPTTQAIGNAWLDAGAGLLMPVPSAILAHSTNYIVNAAHPRAAAQLTESQVEPFWFDKCYLR